MCSLISALLVNHLQKFPPIGAVLELRSHANLINWPLVVSQNKEMEKQQNSGNCNNTLTNAYELEGMGSSSFGLKVFKNICLASNMEEAFKSACVDCPHSHQTKCTLKGYVFNCMHTLTYTYKNKVYFGLNGHQGTQFPQMGALGLQQCSDT